MRRAILNARILRLREFLRKGDILTLPFLCERFSLPRYTVSRVAKEEGIELPRSSVTEIKNIEFLKVDLDQLKCWGYYGIILNKGSKGKNNRRFSRQMPSTKQDDL